LDIVANNFGKALAERNKKYRVSQSIFLWKHIADAHKHTKLTEDAMSDGFVILVDEKNDPHCDTDYFVRDVRLEFLCEDLIKELYLQRTEPEEDGIVLDEEELLQCFDDEYYSFGFFRLKGNTPNSRKEAMEIYFKDFFFAPEAIIFKGEAFEA